MGRTPGEPVFFSKRKAWKCPKCGKGPQSHRNGHCRPDTAKTTARKCRRCGKNCYPNFYWCKSCHGVATDSYADVVPL